MTVLTSLRICYIENLKTKLFGQVIPAFIDYSVIESLMSPAPSPLPTSSDSSCLPIVQVPTQFFVVIKVLMTYIFINCISEFVSFTFLSVLKMEVSLVAVIQVL